MKGGAKRLSFGSRERADQEKLRWRKAWVATGFTMSTATCRLWQTWWRTGRYYIAIVPVQSWSLMRFISSMIQADYLKSAPISFHISRFLLQDRRHWQQAGNSGTL